MPASPSTLWARWWKASGGAWETRSAHFETVWPSCAWPTSRSTRPWGRRPSPPRATATRPPPARRTDHAASAGTGGPYVRCLPATEVAGHDPEGHRLVERDPARSAGDRGAVEEQLPAVVGAQRARAAPLVEGDDGPAPLSQVRRVHGRRSVHDLGERELDDVARAVVLEGGDQRVDLALRDHALHRVAAVPEQLRHRGRLHGGEQREDAIQVALADVELHPHLGPGP